MTLDLKTKYRSVFISDTHLGMRGVNSESLLKFLKSFDCENLYLVGDIIDVWALKKKWYWPNINNEIIAEIFSKSYTSTNVIYLCGNHDEAFRDYIGYIDSIVVVNEHIHPGLDGKKYLVIHGDHYDSLMKHMRWLVRIGGVAYDLMFFINQILNKYLAAVGKDYWSLAEWSKSSIKGAIYFINDFKKVLVNEANHRNCDSIICGHLHHPEIDIIDGIRYINCGDWVENKTAIVETYDGKFELIRYEG